MYNALFISSNNGGDMTEDCCSLDVETHSVGARSIYSQDIPSQPQPPIPPNDDTTTTNTTITNNN